MGSTFRCAATALTHCGASLHTDVPWCTQWQQSPEQLSPAQDHKRSCGLQGPQLYLQDDEPGHTKAVEEGLHDELVVVGDPVVGQVLLAVKRHRRLQLHVVQIADAYGRQAAPSKQGRKHEHEDEDEVSGHKACRELAWMYQVTCGLAPLAHTKLLQGAHLCA